MNAVEDSGDGSTIFLSVIISIVLINLYLIYKVILQSKCKNKRLSGRSKHLTVIFLALSDILVAVFPLDTHLRGMSDDPYMSSFPCWQRVLSQAYLFHLSPFIHATGVVVLIAESVSFWRHQRGTSLADVGHSLCSVQNLLVSLLPWALGLLVVGPMALAGFDFQTCSAQYSLLRVQSLFWISVVLPGALALLAALAYMLIKKPAFSPASSTTTVSPVYNWQFSPSRKSSYFYTEAKHVQETNEFLKAGPEKAQYNDKTSLISFPAVWLEHIWRNESVELMPDHSKDTYENNKALVLTRDIELAAPSKPAEDLTPIFVWERRTRLIGALLFCACSMPSVIVNLVYMPSEDSKTWPDDAQLATHLEFLYRMHVLRSLISPLVWVNEYS